MSIVPESIEYHIAHVPTSILMSLLVWAILLVLSLVVLKSFKYIPGKIQAALEACFEYIFKLADESIGPEAFRYYPLFLGIFLYVLVSNIIGLIPGLISPTSDPYVTVTLALVVFIYYNFQGFLKKGWGYLGHFFGPKLPWYMFPINILMFIIEMISNFARPFSLAMRLFCNIFSKEILLGVLALLVLKFFFGNGPIEKALTVGPLVLRPLILLLGLMIGIIQALIFLVLTISYVAGAVKSEEH
ncbi:MAG: F0F1 ATP synthase subunit A [Elusimicrobia bacterium]|nr:F0F1 ATP synthase subunit A [Elusimicrobiota bacterium]MBU2614975.1 F0F1 ATP synthase subunit A [Elusimicrobiota bacterium]